MFLNLVKYDLKFILKTVLIYAILLLLSAALHNLTSYGYTPTTMDPSTGQIFGGEPDASILIQILHTVFYNAVIAMLIALLLNTIIRTWARFKLNFYSDEAYLTHTLPVTRSLLWASKCFSAAIVIVTVIAVTGLACALLNLTPYRSRFSWRIWRGQRRTILILPRIYPRRLYAILLHHAVWFRWYYYRLPFSKSPYFTRHLSRIWYLLTKYSIYV